MSLRSASLVLSAAMLAGLLAAPAHSAALPVSPTAQVSPTRGDAIFRGLVGSVVRSRLADAAPPGRSAALNGPIKSGRVRARAPAMQRLLDKYLGPGVLSASDDLIAAGGDALWRAETGATTTLLFEMAGNARYNVFGIYDPSAPDYRLPLFYGYAGPGTDATVTLQRLSAGGYRVTVTSNGVSESARFGSSVFGFYLRTPHDRVYFSDTALNQDGFDHMRAYADDGVTLLVWEDQLNGGDRDFNDMGIRISGFLPVSAPAPVPLPAGVMLLGSGLFGLWMTGRRSRLRRPRAAT